MQANLAKLTSLVADHRRDKKRGRYPAAIWESISALREQQHTVTAISKASGITPTQIYRRTSPKSAPQFQELKLSPLPTSTKSVAVELRRVDGAELRIRIEASLPELSALFLEFLR